MQAIELEADIQANGQINLPEIYKNWFGKHAKIIVLEADAPEEEGTEYDEKQELELINRHAEHLNEETQDALDYQMPL